MAKECRCYERIHRNNVHDFSGTYADNSLDKVSMDFPELRRETQ